ncbi:MAG: SPOR domain-containing protein [Novosphingobium sp.]
MVGAGDRRVGVGDGKAIRRRDDFPPEPPAPPAAPYAGGDPLGRAAAPGSRQALDEEVRVPWLEPPDEDIGDDDAVDGARILRFALVPLAALALVGGAVWYAGHRAASPGPADGSLVRAEPGPYKVRPDKPGGETFAGTGDSSFAVSEGESRGARLAPVETPPATLAADTTPGPRTEVGVQLGAFMDAKAAEAGWTAIVQRNPGLGGFSHRVVEGRADIGPVFRLQVVTADVAAATALCASLVERGQGCQVKR